MGGVVPVRIEAPQANPGSRWLRISSRGREDPPSGTAQADRARSAAEEVALPDDERSRSLACVRQLCRCPGSEADPTDNHAIKANHQLSLTRLRNLRSATLNNHFFNRLNAELREGDPLCRYVTLERSSIELTLAQHAENTAQLAIACELLQRTRTELQRTWHDSGKQLQPYQEAALHSINECLAVSHATIRRYR